MRYKVGDRVWLRDDLENEICYGKYFWVTEKKKDCIVTIKRVYSVSYDIIEDSWLYTEEMIDHKKTARLRKKERLAKLYKVKIKEKIMNKFKGLPDFHYVKQLPKEGKTEVLFVGSEKPIVSTCVDVKDFDEYTGFITCVIKHITNTSNQKLKDYIAIAKEKDWNNLITIRENKKSENQKHKEIKRIEKLEQLNSKIVELQNEVDKLKEVK